MSKKSQLGDWNEEKFEYDSARKRRLKRLARDMVVGLAIAAVVIFAVVRLFKTAKCAEAGGFYVREQCAESRCCETLTPKMVNGHIKLN